MPDLDPGRVSMRRTAASSNVQDSSVLSIVAQNYHRNTKMRFIETSLYEVSINIWALEKMCPSQLVIWITLCDKHNNNRQKIISALRAALFACSVTLRKYACYWNTRLLSIVPFLSPQAASTSMTSYGKLLGYCSIMYMWHISDVVISINKGR